MSLIGSVDFFDTKKGWGFIVLLTQGLPQSNTKVFVHFSNVNTQEDSYKRLFPGEYVSFSIGKSDHGKDRGKDTCIDVCGIMGGPLLTDHPDHRYKIYPKETRSDRKPAKEDGAPTAETAETAETSETSETAETAETAEVDEVDENDPTLA